MTQEVSNPLQDIIAKMAKTQVRGECAKLKERMVGATDAVVVLCDVSGSMLDLIGSAGISKYQQLKYALEVIVQFDTQPLQWRIAGRERNLRILMEADRDNS